MLSNRQQERSKFRTLPEKLALTSSQLFCFILLPCLSCIAGEDWTSFQNGGEIQFDGRGRDFSKKWSVAISGYGQSSPVAWKDQVYVTSVSGPNKEKCLVTAFDLQTGVVNWQYETQNATPQESSNYISKAAPSPVVDERGIVCFFEGGNLFALTHAGEVRWERNLIDEYGPIDARHGLAASLEHTQDIVFAWVERQTEPYIIAINKESGENEWKEPGLGVTSWASPRLIPVQGGEHLVLSGAGMIVGYDPASGKRLWEFDEITGNSTPTPMPVSEGTFLIGATVRRGEGDSGRAAESNGLISITQTDAGSWSASYVWHSKRATSSFGSPICSENHCYFMNRSGVLYCLDKATGKELYAKRVGGSLWATPIAFSQSILLPLKDGKLTVVSKGPKIQALMTSEVFSVKPSQETEKPPSFGGKTLYAAILVGNRTIIRSGDQLFSLMIQNNDSNETDDPNSK